MHANPARAPAGPGLSARGWWLPTARTRRQPRSPDEPPAGLRAASSRAPSSTAEFRGRDRVRPFAGMPAVLFSCQSRTCFGSSGTARASAACSAQENTCALAARKGPSSGSGADAGAPACTPESRPRARAGRPPARAMNFLRVLFMNSPLLMLLRTGLFHRVPPVEPLDRKELLHPGVVVLAGRALAIENQRVFPPQKSRWPW